MATKETRRAFSRRRFLAGGAAAGGFALLAACGGAGTGEAMPAEEMKELKRRKRKPSSRRWSPSPWSSATGASRPHRDDVGSLVHLADETFREANPQVEAIEYTFVPFGAEYIQKLTTESPPA